MTEWDIVWTARDPPIIYKAVLSERNRNKSFAYPLMTSDVARMLLLGYPSEPSPSVFY